MNLWAQLISHTHTCLQPLCQQGLGKYLATDSGCLDSVCDGWEAQTTEREKDTDTHTHTERYRQKERERGIIG